MAAYECGTLDFPEPPYPNTIQCPQVELTLFKMFGWLISYEFKVVNLSTIDVLLFKIDNLNQSTTDNFVKQAVVQYPMCSKLLTCQQLISLSNRLWMEKVLQPPWLKLGSGQLLPRFSSDMKEARASLEHYRWGSRPSAGGWALPSENCRPISWLELLGSQVLF